MTPEQTTSPFMDHKLLSPLLDAVRAIVWECDPATLRFSHVEQRAETILGYPCRQWIGEPDFWRSRIHPEDAETSAALFREAVQEGENRELEHRMTAADGTLLWFRTIVTPVTTGGGEVRLQGVMIDISESREARMKLQAIEERFQLAMLGANDGIWDWNLLTDEVYFSPRWKEMLGYQDHELENRLDTWATLTHPDDRQATLELARDYVEGRSDTLETEFRMQHREGHYISILSRGLLSRDEQGRGVRLVGTNVDITRQRRAEEELHLARLCMDQAPMGIFRLDLDMNVLYANRHACESLGYSREELCRMSVFDFDPEFRRENLAEHLEKMRQQDGTTFEAVHRNRDGAIFPVEITSTSLEYQGEAFLFSFASNISERKRTERELRESEERYRRLVELSPDAIVIHSGSRFVFMNPAAVRLLGATTPEELYGREPLDFIHPGQRELVGQRIGNALGRGDNPPIEELMVRLDGSTVPVEMVSVHYIYQGKDAVLAIARDISERKRVQDELVKTQKLESLGLLAGGIAHDFNNILTGILGNISLVLSRLDPASPLAGRLEQCEKAAMRATDLTRQLLTFARGGEPVRKVIDPASLIRESSDFVLSGTNVKSDVQIATDLCCIDVDPGQISQVLNNLMINATHAMPGGGVIKVTATNETIVEGNVLNLTPGDYLRISVEDHGCGIPPENLSRIFDPYFTTKRRGSGLGLASSYSIIRRHGGVIGVSSRVGVGTTFTILLPALSQEREAHGTTGPREELGGNGRILVMDDEELIQEVSREILEAAGYSVECCADGGEALEHFHDAREKNTPFDAVVMDLTIPGGMGGKETAELIRALDSNAVLIVSSGYSSDPVIANYQRYGFSGAVIKPFSFQSLAGEVRRLIGKRR